MLSFRPQAMKMGNHTCSIDQLVEMAKPIGWKGIDEWMIFSSGIRATIRKPVT